VLSWFPSIAAAGLVPEKTGVAELTPLYEPLPFILPLCAVPYWLRPAGDTLSEELAPLRMPTLTSLFELAPPPLKFFAMFILPSTPPWLVIMRQLDRVRRDHDH
jgi:hypothetical protein